jgi:protein NUD1
LSTLIHLRELRVDNNILTSLDGIFKLDGLLRISAKHNQISSLDFTESKLPRLEVLDGQQNCIGWVDGLDDLPCLMSLHLDDNNITALQPKAPLRSLRTLKLCRNELEAFDAKFCPDLRTLYLDHNSIQAFHGIRKLRFLENFSARSQRGKASLSTHGLSELRKLYLSGTPPKQKPAMLIRRKRDPGTVGQTIL